MAPFLTLRYDLRGPDFSVGHGALYSAMLEQVKKAEQIGFHAVSFSEHHVSDDGYLPSPLVVAAAVAGATTSIRISISAILLPLYDIVRLAEDMAVLDLVSGGRVDLIIGAGYRPSEYEMFGKEYRNRVQNIEEGIPFLRQAWTGEPFEYKGRTIQILPKPLRPGGPMLMLGGSAPAAARRAARIADGFIPTHPDLVAVYLEECEKLGKAPGIAAGSSGPMFMHVSKDPDAAWKRIAPFALHETNSYGDWLSRSGGGPYVRADDADSLRASGNYVVMTPEECIAFAREHGSLTFHPLMGGMDPEISAECFKLIEEEVLPAFN